MKYTNLELTQEILSNLSSDEVNSVSDTPESLQILGLIRQKYFDIINRLDLPDHDQLIQLLPSIDSNSPVIMYIPDGVSEIKWLKYFDNNISGAVNLLSNTTDIINGVPVTDVNLGPLSPPGYCDVFILPNRQFIDMVSKFNTNESDVETFTFSDTSNKFNGNYTFYFKNDHTPSYCTILSNYYVIFDSFDNTVDSTLQSSKTMALGSVIPKFEMNDTFIPDLSEEQFSLLLNEVKALAFYELKQQPHQLALQETKRGWSSIQKKKSVANKPDYFDQLPDFGRKGVYQRYPALGGVYSWR